MGKTELLLSFTVGTALLALWTYVRWPGAAPATLKGAAIRVALALLLMQLGAGLVGFGVEAAPGLTVPLVVGVVLPVLTYAFLASLWFLNLFAGRLRGGL